MTDAHAALFACRVVLSSRSVEPPVSIGPIPAPDAQRSESDNRLPPLLADPSMFRTAELVPMTAVHAILESHWASCIRAWQND